MLQNFSDRIRNSRWLGYGIVIAIAIPFALVGIQAYIQGGGGDVAAEVNGTPIQRAHVDRQVAQQRAQLRQQFGGELPSMFSDSMLREQVLNQLIRQEVMRQAAADARMRIGAERLAKRIREQEFFRQNGQFNRELYRQVLSRSGLTPQAYESQMRQAFQVDQLRTGVSNTAFVLPQEARASARMQRQERQVGVLEYPQSRAAEQIEITPADIQSYYDQNQDRYQSPPRVRVAYLELDLAAVAETVEVTTEELRTAYREQQQREQDSSERQAAHILIEVPDDATDAQIASAREKAERLRARLASGEAKFAELAREHSDDPGSAKQGGDLGYVARGTMVPPFEEALFGLESPGDVSEPIRTGYGFHVIKLLDERGGQEQQRTFADAREELEQQLRRRKAENLLRDRAEVLRNQAYENPGSLEPAAQATGLEVQQSDWFSRREGEGIGASEVVREAAFREEVRRQGTNSDLLELGDRRLAVVRVIEEQPAKTKPLDAVREEVREQLRRERMEQVFAEWAESIVARLDDGMPPQKLAGEDVRYRDLGWIRRDDGGASASVASAAFALAPPNDGGVAHRAVGLESGDHAVVIVRQARLPEVEAPAVQQAHTELRRGLTEAELNAWAQGLRAKAEVTRP